MIQILSHTCAPLLHDSSEGYHLENIKFNLEFSAC
jgi:hypothetical protein